MKSKEFLNISENQILVDIESNIGRQLETSDHALLDLDLSAAQIVMSFLIETLVKENGASLKDSPLVILSPRDNKILSFFSNFELLSPIKTKVAASGLIVGRDSGTPHLLNDKVDISVSSRLAGFALNASGLPDMVRDILNHLPDAIKHTLPNRLKLLGFNHNIASVFIFFEGDHIKAIINR